MPRSRQRQQGSRQNNPQSYGSRGGGFEETGTGYRNEEQQNRFAQQSRGRFGGNWSDQGENWSGSRSSDYGRESFGRGGYEGSRGAQGFRGYEGGRGMGQQQDWTRGRTGSYGGYTRVGWGPADEGEQGSWGDEYRFGRGSQDTGYDDEEYRGMGPGYPESESYYGGPERFGGRQAFMGGGRSGQEESQGWGRSQGRGMSGSSSQWGQSRGQRPQGSFAGRGPQGYKRSDERITEDVNEALTQDHELDASNITVEVQNGEIILKGTVTDRESKRRAEDIAESCSGVREVQNQLRIKREDETEMESRRDKGEKGEDKRSHRQQIAS